MDLLGMAKGGWTGFNICPPKSYAIMDTVQLNSLLADAGIHVKESTNRNWMVYDDGSYAPLKEAYNEVA